jgi:protein involved in polysaccharide export with SLBB domain
MLRLLLAVFLIAVGSLTTANAAGRRVAASDVIQIHVLNQPDLDTQVRVAPDGTISVPYVGRLRSRTDRGCDCSPDQEGPNKRRHSQMRALN